MLSAAASGFLPRHEHRNPPSESASECSVAQRVHCGEAADAFSIVPIMGSLVFEFIDLYEIPGVEIDSHGAHQLLAADNHHHSRTAPMPSHSLRYQFDVSEQPCTAAHGAFSGEMLAENSPSILHLLCAVDAASAPDRLFDTWSRRTRRADGVDYFSSPPLARAISVTPARPTTLD